MGMSASGGPWEALPEGVGVCGSRSAGLLMSISLPMMGYSSKTLGRVAAVRIEEGREHSGDAD